MRTFEITKKDIQKAKMSYVESMNPFKLKVFPKKEKQKVILLDFIIELFDKDRIYTEKEVNQILMPVYEDFAILRRYLVDYNLLNRLDNGSAYWVFKNIK